MKLRIRDKTIQDVPIKIQKKRAILYKYNRMKIIAIALASLLVTSSVVYLVK